ncbi:MAG: thioredoxin domain-containing protein [Saprospiraceae bacterium]
MRYHKFYYILIILLSFYGCKTNHFSKSTDEKKDNNSIEEVDMTPKQQQLSNNLKFYYGGTLTEIIDRSNKENKPVFIDFTAAWCAPCKLMDEEIYSYKAVYEFYNEKFINFKIDIEKDNGPNIAFLYEVSTLPAMVFLDKKGRIITKTTGSVGIQKLLDIGNEALMKFDTISN